MEHWVLGLALLAVLAAFALWQWWSRATLVVSGMNSDAAGQDWLAWNGTYQDIVHGFQITMKATPDMQTSEINTQNARINQISQGAAFKLEQTTPDARVYVSKNAKLTLLLQQGTRYVILEELINNPTHLNYQFKKIN